MSTDSIIFPSVSHNHDTTAIDADLAALRASVGSVQSAIAALAARVTALETPAIPVPPVVVDTAPVGDLPGWRQVFLDRFDAAPDNARYSSYPEPWGDTRYKQGDTANGGVYSGLTRCAVSGGILTITLGRDASGKPRSVAFCPRINGTATEQLYGRYAIRFRAAMAVGWKTAWLLWPKSEVWPRDGEIDFPEGNLNGTISGFMHRQGATQGSDQYAASTTARYTDWHTAVIEWKPGSCEFLLDGVSVGKTTSRVPNTAMRWVIQSETALDGSIPAAAASIEVDWLAVWAYAP